MLFRITSSKHKRELREKEVLYLKLEKMKWHAFFTMWPRRISPTHVAWFSWITRRADPNQTTNSVLNLGIQWEYGPLTNLLFEEKEGGGNVEEDPGPF